MIAPVSPPVASTRRATGLFAHSRWDLLLVAVAVGQFATLLYGSLSFGAVGWPASLGLGLWQAFLVCTNYQSVAHNFLHNPFFRSRRLNDLFGVFNSLLIGAPHSLYRLHHLRHHKYNNDAPDPLTGQVNDHTSTYRFSPDGKREEPLASYALLAYFRNDFLWLVREARRKRVLGMAAIEMAAHGALLAGLAWLNPWGLICFYVPVWLLGNIGAMAQNYLEHHGAIPGDRRTDSVSCYGRFYNLIWFNNGYHQEHHYRPQVHWTRLPLVKSLLPGESERRVVACAHWFNVGRQATALRERRAAERAAQRAQAGARRVQAANASNVLIGGDRSAHQRGGAHDHET